MLLIVSFVYMSAFFPDFSFPLFSKQPHVMMFHSFIFSALVKMPFNIFGKL